MTKLFLRILLYSIYLVPFLCTYTIAIAADAEKKSLGEAETNIPGVTFQVTDIQRIDAHSLLVVIRVNVSTSAQNPTFIGKTPAAGGKDPKALTPEDIASGKYDPQPLLLTSALLIDQLSKKQYKALPHLPSTPFLGPNSFMSTLRPGSWVQLAVQFPLPPPPPPESGAKAPDQKISLLLPEAKATIKDIPLPSEK